MRLFLVMLAGLLAAAPSAAAAVPVLHAHRGGSISFGSPDQYEDTLDAFQRRVEQTPGVWLEMDAGVSSDGVPFVIHDSTLDRTTTCTGALLDRTAAEIDQCQVDVLGVQSGNPATVAPKPAGSPVVRVSRLAVVLALARQAGAPVNLEIKRIPGDPHYTPGDTTFATHVMDVVKAAGLPRDKLIIQSFDPTNLDVAKQALPGVVTAFLTSAPDPATVGVCAQRGYDYLSPGGVPDAATMAAARAMGVKVVPYTLDTTADIQAAAAAGVDAIITNDIPLARQALGLGTTGPIGSSGASGPAQPGGPATPEPAPTPPVGPAGPAGPPGPASPTPPAGPAGPVGPSGATKDEPRRMLRVKLLDTRRREVVTRKGLRVDLRGSRGATARIRITLRRTLLARARLRLTADGHQQTRIRLTARGRRVLAARRGPVTVTVRTLIAGRLRTSRQRLG